MLISNKYATTFFAGDSVNIEGLGTFYPKMTAKMVDTAADATVNNCVKDVTIGFRPSNELKEVINKSGFRVFAPPTMQYQGRDSYGFAIGKNKNDDRSEKKDNISTH